MDTSLQLPFEINIDDMYKFITENKYQTITDQDLHYIIINSNLQIKHEDGDITNNYKTFNIASILPDKTISTPQRIPRVQRFDSPQGVDQLAESFSKHEKPKDILQKAIRDYFDTQKTDLIKLSSNTDIQFTLDDKDETKKNLKMIIEHILIELNNNAKKTIQESQSQSLEQDISSFSQGDSQDKTDIDDNKIVELEINKKINTIFENRKPYSTEDHTPATPLPTDYITSAAKNFINPIDSQNKSPKKSPKKYQSIEEKSHDGEYGLEDMPPVETTAVIQLNTENSYINTFLLALPRGKVNEEINEDTPMGMVLRVMNDKKNTINQQEDDQQEDDQQEYDDNSRMDLFYTYDNDDIIITDKTSESLFTSQTTTQTIINNEEYMDYTEKFLDTFQTIEQCEQLLGSLCPDMDLEYRYERIESLLTEYDEEEIKEEEMEEGEVIEGGGLIEEEIIKTKNTGIIIEDLMLLLSFIKQRAEIPHDFPIERSSASGRMFEENMISQHGSDGFDRTRTTKDQIIIILEHFINYFLDNSDKSKSNKLLNIYHTIEGDNIKNLLINLTIKIQKETAKGKKLLSKRYEWEYFEQIMNYIKNLDSTFNIERNLKYSKCFVINDKGPIKVGTETYNSLVASGYIKIFKKQKGKNYEYESIFLCDDYLRPYNYSEGDEMKKNYPLIDGKISDKRIKYNMVDTGDFIVPYLMPLLNKKPLNYDVVDPNYNSPADIYDYNKFKRDKISMASCNIFTFLDPASNRKITGEPQNNPNHPFTGDMQPFFLKKTSQPDSTGSSVPGIGECAKNAAKRTFEHSINKYRIMMGRNKINVKDTYFDKSGTDEYDTIVVEWNESESINTFVTELQFTKGFHFNDSMIQEVSYRYNSKRAIEHALLYLSTKKYIPKNEEPFSKFIYPYMILLGADLNRSNDNRENNSIRNTDKNKFLLISIKGEGDAGQVMYLNYLRDELLKGDNEVKKLRDQIFISTVDKNVFSHALLMDVPCLMGNAGLKVIFDKTTPQGIEQTEKKNYFFFSPIFRKVLPFLNIDNVNENSTDMIKNIHKLIGDEVNILKEDVHTYNCLTTYGITESYGNSQQPFSQICSNEQTNQCVKDAIKETIYSIQQLFDNYEYAKNNSVTLHIKDYLNIFGRWIGIDETDETKLLKTFKKWQRLHKIIINTLDLKQTIETMMKIKMFKIKLFLNYIDFIVEATTDIEWSNNNEIIDPRAIKNLSKEIKEEIRSIFIEKEKLFNKLIEKISDKKYKKKLKEIRNYCYELSSNQPIDIESWDIKKYVDRKYNHRIPKRSRNELDTYIIDMDDIIDNVNGLIKRKFTDVYDTPIQGGGGRVQHNKIKEDREKKIRTFFAPENLPQQEEENESNQQVNELNNEIIRLTKESNDMKQNLEQLINNLKTQVQEKEEIITELEQEKNSLITELEQEKNNLQQTKITEDENKEEINRINIRLNELTIQTTQQEQLIEEYQQIIQEIKNKIKMRDNYTKRGATVDDNNNQELNTSGNKNIRHAFNKVNEISNIIEEFQERNEKVKEEEEVEEEELRVVEQVEESKEKSGNEEKEGELGGGSRIRSSSKTRHNRVNNKKSKKTNKNRGWMW